jgi:thiol-disulfide isomerase/thioredoxin
MILKTKGTLAAVVFGMLVFSNSGAKAQTSKEVVITGKVAIQNPEIFKKYNMVWLYKGIGKAKKVVDSVRVNADGSFTLRVKPSTAALYQLDLLKWQTAVFWSDQDVNISARGYDTARVKARNSGYVSVESKSRATQLINSAVYNQYLAAKEMDLLTEESYAAMRSAKPKDSTWLTYLRSNGLIKSKTENEALRLKQMIKTNEGNPALVYLLGIYPIGKDNAFFESSLSKLLATYPQLAEAKQLKKEYLEQNALKNALKTGSEIPGIVYNDPNGKSIDIKSFKGKYVLIDFWASWCGPCRKAIPEIKTLYSQYKEKGFEVFSVSVDTDNAAWRKAMAEEAMPWTQVLSPNKNKTLADFMIIGIPTLYLVDREGKIVEKYTGFSSKLKSQLEGIFKDKI